MFEDGLDSKLPNFLNYSGMFTGNQETMPLSNNYNATPLLPPSHLSFGSLTNPDLNTMINKSILSHSGAAPPPNGMSYNGNLPFSLGGTGVKEAGNDINAFQYFGNPQSVNQLGIDTNPSPLNMRPNELHASISGGMVSNNLGLNPSISNLTNSIPPASLSPPMSNTNININNINNINIDNIRNNQINSNSKTMPGSNANLVENRSLPKQRGRKPKKGKKLTPTPTPKEKKATTAGKGKKINNNNNRKSQSPAEIFVNNSPHAASNKATSNTATLEDHTNDPAELEKFMELAHGSQHSEESPRHMREAGGLDTTPIKTMNFMGAELPIGEKFVTKQMLDGLIISCSSNMEKFLGYDPNSLHRTSAYELIHPEDLTQVLQSHLKLLENGTTNPVTTQYRVLRKDGRYATLHSLFMLEVSESEEDGDLSLIILSMSVDLSLEKYQASLIDDPAAVSALANRNFAFAPPGNSVDSLRQQIEYLKSSINRTNHIISSLKTEIRDKPNAQVVSDGTGFGNHHALNADNILLNTLSAFNTTNSIHPMITNSLDYHTTLAATTNQNQSTASINYHSEEQDDLSYETEDSEAEAEAEAEADDDDDDEAFHLGKPVNRHRQAPKHRQPRNTSASSSSGNGQKPKAKRERKIRRPPFGDYCGECQVEESSEWRKGPTADKLLCNACGLRYTRKLKKEERQRMHNQHAFHN